MENSFRYDTQSVNPVLTKVLAVKVPKQKVIDTKYQNETNIIHLFKNGVSAYILKYYKSQQSNF